MLRRLTLSAFMFFRGGMAVRMWAAAFVYTIDFLNLLVFAYFGCDSHGEAVKVENNAAIRSVVDNQCGACALVEPQSFHTEYLCPGEVYPLVCAFTEAFCQFFFAFDFAEVASGIAIDMQAVGSCDDLSGRNLEIIDGSFDAEVC